VQLDVTAGAEDAASLADTLRELAARLGLELHVGPSAAAATGVGQGERARVTVTETSDRADIAIAQVLDGHLAAPVTRTLPKNESSAIETEQIAHVVYAALESMFATDKEGAQGAASPPAPPPVPTPAPAVASSPAFAPKPAPEPAQTLPAPPDQPASSAPGGRPGLAAMLFATGSGVATSSGAVPGVGAEARLSLGRGFGHPYFWGQGSTAAAFAEQTADVTVETNVTSLRGGADFALVSAGRIGVAAGAGAGADVFHTVPVHASPRVALEPTMDLADPIVTARILAGIRLPGGARAIAGATLDLDLAAHHYVTALASGAHDGVYQPWAARPTVLLGVCIPLLAGGGCIP
jgi:hypothetical protein